MSELKTAINTRYFASATLWCIIATVYGLFVLNNALNNGSNGYIQVKGY